MNVCVIGAGPAGLTSAINLARQKYQVFILERNNKSGKKLLLTGNGRCNYWNEDQNINHYHSNNLKEFTNIYEKQKDKVLDFFQSIGIIPKIKDGYYYPYSNQATSVLNALLTEVKNLNIPIYYEEFVTKIEKKDQFYITTQNKVYKAAKVIIATGGKSYPKTGSDGNGYTLAQNLGHKIIPIKPALTYLKGQDNFYKDWDGIRSSVIVTHLENGEIKRQEKGEIQLTKEGLSGICIFNLSRQIAKGLEKNYTEIVSINFVPWCSNFLEFMDKQEQLLNNYTLKEILEGFLNYKLINLFFKLAKLPNDITWSKVNKQEFTKLLTNFQVKITSTGSYDTAQVCSGGIALNELTSNLESKKIKDLYFAGEIIDVDGDCGGYNLGFAWMSGLTIGKDTKEND